MPINLGNTKVEEVGCWQDYYEPTSTDRVKRLRERNFQPVELSLERARAEIKAYEAYKDEPRVIQRARMFETYLRDKEVKIYEDELIVGNVTEKYRCSPVSGEQAANWMRADIDDPERDWTVRPRDPHAMTDAERAELKDVILPYWEGKTFEEYCNAKYPADIAKRGVPTGEDPHIPMITKMMDTKDLGHMMPDFEHILTCGLMGIRKQVEWHLAQLEHEHHRVQERRDFYQAALIGLDAAMAYSRRYAELARQMAEDESDEARKAELLRIAEITERVPAYPARDWYEAVQSVYFIQLLVHCEMVNVANSFGRFDQWMYPYYKKSVMDEKTMTRGQAQEILECMLIKIADFTVLFNYDVVKSQAGYSMSQAMTLGGQKRDGSDACNEVTMLTLDAEENVLLTSPDLAFIMWDGTPEKYLRRAAEVNRLGGGKPKFFANKTLLKQAKLIYPDISDEDLLEGIGIMGCCEACFGGLTQHNGFGGLLSMGTVMEITLHNGRCPQCGQLIGLETGDPRNFRSVRDVQDAFEKQVRYFAHTMCRTIKYQFDAEGERMQVPFCSTLVEGTLNKGLDLTQGGAPYTVWGILYGAPIDIGDSLGVIDKLIYQQKKITWDQLLDALEHNWEGHEDLRDICVNGVPKYGNDDDYADHWVTWVTNMTADVTEWLNTLDDVMPVWGGQIVQMHTAVTTHVSFGYMTGALPNGHRAFEPVIDSLSPGQGLDRKGPSAVLRSVAKNPYERFSQGSPLNQKLSPALVAGERGIDNFVAFLRMQNELGIEHMQVNVVSSELLKEAMANPEEHKNLMVRVAAYMAYFTELDEVTQQDIVNRTEQMGW